MSIWSSTFPHLNSTQSSTLQSLVSGAGNTYRPQSWNSLAGMSGGVNDDTLAVTAAIAAAVADGDGTVDLGNGTYRCTAPIGTLITKPISIIGSGHALLIIDKSLSGDLLSFSNTWYGSDTTNLPGGSTGVGTSLTAVSWPSRNSRRHGVKLAGFRVTGDRTTEQTQNGIIFYDRNDNVLIRDVQIDFVRGYGCVLSGLASNPGANASSVMRESTIENLHTRWCGDYLTARPAVVLNSTDRGPGSSDDACNYNEISGLKVMFSDGVGFQTNCHNLNSNQFSNNVIQVTVDSPQNLSTASSAGSKASITNGVLTIDSGGTVTGTFSVGQYLDNANVPIGTYISAVLTGSGDVGTYRLANRVHDISALNVVAGGNMSTLRCCIPFMQVHGGHVGDRWDVIVNGSNAAGTGAPGISFNHNTLHASTAKTQACELSMFVGAIDVGVIFTVIGSMEWKLRARSAVTTLTALNVTTGVNIDVGPIGSSADLAIGGDLSKLHVFPGFQKVVTALPASAAKWPQCELLLRSGSNHTRYVSDGSSWLAT